jgi:hypothetical protein
MSESGSVEYCFLRYVPNVVSGMSVAIAVILVDPSGPEKGICGMILAPNWQSEVQLIDPECDLQVLEALLTEIRDRLVSECHRADMLRQIEDSFANVIQVSQRRKCPTTLRPEAVEAFARGLFEQGSKTSLFFSSTQAPMHA